MTFEQFGIGLLCVSQGLMWWRVGYFNGAAAVRHVDAFAKLHDISGAIARLPHAAQLSDIADSIEMKIDALGKRKTRSDAGKPRKGRNGTASDEGLQPSDDTIGPVST